MNLDLEKQESNSTDSSVITASFEESPFDENPFAAENSYVPAVSVDKELSKRDTTVMEAPEEYKARLKQLPQVQELTNKIDINNPRTVEMFGQEAGDGISRVADNMLASTRAIKTSEITAMMDQLSNVMKKVDASELDLDDMSGKRGFFGKLRMRAKESLEELINRYDNVGKEVDKIAQILNGYMTDIDQTNKNLLKMYDANMQFYKQLEWYIAAADCGLDELTAEIDKVNADTTKPNEEKSFLVSKYTEVANRLEQRKVDLQTAEVVSLQLQPTIMMMMSSNYRLMGKINTSFIITLPVFKIALSNAIMLKRQEIEARSIAQLDATTNDFLERNAKNTATQTKAIAKMANQTGIKIETLEKVQTTIIQGAEETQQIIAEASRKRKEDSAQMDKMIYQMKQKGFAQ
jgi:uncharacterized protein YaaN involved in tellurite resistance